MQAVSQALVDFANGFRQPPEPGFEVIETPRYLLVLQPDLPAPGPNNAGWIRCSPENADEMIEEVTALFAARGLPFMWIIDPGATPADFAERLAAHGAEPDPHAPESAVMVLPIETRFDAPDVPGLELHDALSSPERFRGFASVASESFGGPILPDTPAVHAQLERRRQNQIAAGNRRVILATLDGEPAGSSGLSLYPPRGAIINGGAVRPTFRGRGVYLAMVAARLELARRAGVPGLTVWGGPMSAPILGRLGFQKVGWRRFYRSPDLG